MGSDGFETAALFFALACFLISPIVTLPLGIIAIGRYTTTNNWPRGEWVRAKIGATNFNPQLSGIYPTAAAVNQRAYLHDDVDKFIEFIYEMEPADLMSHADQYSPLEDVFPVNDGHALGYAEKWELLTTEFTIANITAAMDYFANDNLMITVDVEYPPMHSHYDMQTDKKINDWILQHKENRFTLFIDPDLDSDTGYHRASTRPHAMTTGVSLLVAASIALVADLALVGYLISDKLCK